MSKKILVVEDEEDVAELISNWLQRAGWYVAKVHDGVNALDIILKTKPDLITLDLMLPLMTGEEICKTVRENENPKISRIPIIMVTAKATHIDRVVGKVIGADSYIVKPFDPCDIVNEAARLLNRKKITYR